jgi:hypothetical protein
MNLRDLEAELEHHVRAAGRSRAVRGSEIAQGTGQLNVCWIGSALVALPRFRWLQTAQYDVSEFQAIRRKVSDLWWQAGLRETSLFVPAFERLVFDSITLARKTC